jgi:hypothetical protein
MESNHKDVLTNLAAGKIDDEITATLVAAGKEVAKNYTA